MPLKNRPARCGCEKRLGLFNATSGPYTCCPACGDAPCFYSIISPCPIYIDDEKILDKCTLMRKDCVQGCTWSSRWNFQDSLTGTGQVELPLISPGSCEISRCPEGVVPPTGCFCEARCFDLEFTRFRGDFPNVFPCYSGCMDGDEPIIDGCYGPCADVLTGTGSAGTAVADLLPIRLKLRLTGPSLQGPCVYKGQWICRNYFECITVQNDYPGFVIINATLTFQPGMPSSGSLLIETYTTLGPSGLHLGTPIGGSCTEVRFNVNTGSLTCMTGSGTGTGTGSESESVVLDISDAELNPDRTIRNLCNGGNGQPPADAIFGGFVAMLSQSENCDSDATNDNTMVIGGGETVAISIRATPCHWPDSIPELVGTGSVVGTGTGTDIDQFKKWILDLGVDEATLVLSTRSGHEATYIRSPVEPGTGTSSPCEQPRTFMLDAYDEELSSLPRQLCVIPIGIAPPLVCDSAEEQCACCDKGDDLPYKMYFYGCNGLVGSEGILTRVAGTADIADGIPMPESAPCGVFPLFLSTGEPCQGGKYNGDIALIVYCNGSTYQIDSYCYNTETSQYESSGFASVTFYDCRCGGPLFGITLSELDCCCGCCGIDVSSVNLQVISMCSNVPSGNVTLTKFAVDDYRGLMIGGINFRVWCEDGEWKMGMGSSGCGGNWVASSAVCDPFEIVFPQTAVFPAFPFPGVCSCSTTGGTVGGIVTL